MPGISIGYLVDGQLIGATASASLYVLTAGLEECNLAVISNVDMVFTMYDGFGNATSPLTQSPIPHTVNVAPTGPVFSTGGRTYVTTPKASGTSVTTIANLLRRLGPWIKIVFYNTEGGDGTFSVQGEI